MNVQSEQQFVSSTFCTAAVQRASRCFKLTSQGCAFLQLRDAGGASACISRLHNVSAEKAGSCEELVALFVAMLRAAGLLVRYVR